MGDRLLLFTLGELAEGTGVMMPGMAAHYEQLDGIDQLLVLRVMRRVVDTTLQDDYIGEKKHDGKPTFTRARGATEFLDLAQAYLSVATGLLELEEAVERYQGSSPDLELPEFATQMGYPMESALHDIDVYQEAYDAIENDLPVAAAVNFVHKTVASWTTPMPMWLLYDLASQADSRSLPFRDQADQHAAAEQTRKQHNRGSDENKILCGRPTKAGGACASRAVTWPGKTRGPACSRHLTEQEADELEQLYLRAVDTQPCRGCQADPGARCTSQPSRQRRVDGYYSGWRSMGRRKVHAVRLSDFATATKKSPSP
ncbi:hypothetical protein EAH68_13730 [Corynebacterium hylobatis]|uniref:Uncharacterized protein n=1 Tax=Corynebacterium hylobatis TaxID=1859290 RepID=A0A430HUP8_9CORY|nr:hypothetical protein [Corynebacterium hylobatis]RSZ61318.1 hypothetical protein EAH68_13730 [Corynebacterium hylobatis]